VTSPYTPNAPDQEQVQLRIMDAQVTLSRWVSYDFASDYLTPASGFHFVVADEDLPELERNALRLAARVRLTINDVPLCDGHIDSIDISASRGQGTVWKIAGRERLGLAVDAIADPTLQIKESFTLAQTLELLYFPFGWIGPDAFSISNAASRGVTQGLRGMPMTKGGRNKGPRALKNFKMHQCKPHNHEGLHDFAKRMTERHGLWIRCSEDGDRIIVDTPDYEQEPSFQIRRTRNGDTNVLDGSVHLDFSTQPSCIIADGQSQSGEFGRGRIKSFCVNPYFGTTSDGFVLDDISNVVKKHPTAKQVVITTQPFERRAPNVPSRIVFLHDEESTTQEQLDNFVRREMSLAMRKAFTAKYTVEGHGQMVDGRFVPWMVDTVVNVEDEVAGIQERLWVNGVSYSKSRGSGTTTNVDLLRLFSIQLFDQTPPPSPGGKSTSASSPNPLFKEIYRQVDNILHPMLFQLDPFREARRIDPFNPGRTR
jgi:prophage tail gpP-like protein